MSEFGRMIICGNHPEYKIIVNGVIIKFEDHPYCGPMPIRKDGGGRILPDSHKFWKVVSWWYQQGKKTDKNGFCWYEEPEVWA